MLDAFVDAAQNARIGHELGGALNREDAMLVDRELVILVELQQAPRVGKRGDDFFQHAQLVQPPEQLAQPARLRNERQKLLGSLGVDLSLQIRRGGTHRFPGGRGDPLVVRVGQLAQPQHFIEIGFQLVQAAGRSHDLLGRDAIIALDLVAEDRAPHVQPNTSRPPVGHEVADHAAHRASVSKIATHELFDGQNSLGALMAVQGRQPHLLGAIEHIVRFPGMKMQLVAQPQQKFGRIAHVALVGLADGAQKLQGVGIGRAVLCKSQPAQ